MAEEESMTASTPLEMEDTFTHWARLVEVSYGEDEADGARVIAARQDPDSFVLGTTVWDSSKTLLKYIEQHGDTFRTYSSMCELGAGCGALAGIAFAINSRGLSDIVLTDIAPVLPWLRENVNDNLTDTERQRLRVEEHNWGTPVGHLRGPFDCILCADVVYEKDCVHPLMQSLLALSHRKTVIYVANERRAPMVHDEYMRYMTKYFIWKELPRSELDAGYIKEAIQVFELRPKKRTIPTEMLIIESDQAKEDEEDEETSKDAPLNICHPLWKGKDTSGGRGGGPDPYDRDLWDDLLK